MIIDVIWIGGPHDGQWAGILEDDLPRARRCDCHGALYLADKEECRWTLTHDPDESYYEDVLVDIQADVAAGRGIQL